MLTPSSHPGGPLVFRRGTIASKDGVDALIGRATECAAINELLGDARSGVSRVLVVRGEAGIGKSGLLQYAAHQALDMTVLAARGIEGEAELAFSGLFELLRPILPALDRIPEPQASALRGALTLGPPTRSTRFVIGAATLSLLAAHAEQSPVLVLIDDAHWVDASSADALVFAVRRLLAERIAVLLAVRTGEESPFATARLPELDIAGLDAADATALLLRHVQSTVSPETCAWLFRATAGNPLALIEVAPAAARLGVESFDRPLSVETRVERAFARQVERLSAAARQALLLAAAAGSSDLVPIIGALESMGLSPMVLEEAESAGVIQISVASFEFRHPLVRSAAYRAAPPNQRRAAHRALAAQLTAPRHADERAWHLASASLGPDDEIASGLDGVGRRARQRGAYAAAASAFERAAQLTAADQPHAQRLLAAADAAWLAGDADRAFDLLDQARLRTADVRTRAEIDRLRARVAMRRGPVVISHDILASAADAIQDVDPAEACMLLAEAADALLFAAMGPRMLATARQAWALAAKAGVDRVTAFFTHMALGQALIINSQGSAGARLIREAVSMMEASPELQQDPRLVAWAGRGRLFLRDLASGSDLIHRAVELAREEGAIGMLAVALNQMALDSSVSDRWTAAHAQFAEAIRLARETGQINDLCSDLAALSRLEARQGRAEDCRANAAETLELADRLGLGMFRTWAYLALTMLELGLGHVYESIAHARSAQDVLDELGFQDPDVSPAPEMVEAFVRVGMLSEARQVAEDYVRLAEEKQLPWALARATRCRGLLADEASFDQYFRLASDLHAMTADSFESARTLLCYGERLRRTRRRAQARDKLRRAFDIFDRLDAAPWAERARLELLATGATARRREASTLDLLTPQEFQIAQVLAAGATTRQAAAKLFLSPKTIEFHLHHVYDKLGVRTRTSLAHLLADQTDGAAS